MCHRNTLSKISTSPKHIKSHLKDHNNTIQRHIKVKNDLIKSGKGHKIHLRHFKISIKTSNVSQMMQEMALFIHRQIRIIALKNRKTKTNATIC